MPSLLYRGVPTNTRRGKEALDGIVRPRGISTNYKAHVRGEDADCDITSWTRDLSVARRFGDFILVLDHDDVAERIVPHPLPSRYPIEQEVLVRGEITNVKRYDPAAVDEN